MDTNDTSPEARAAQRRATWTIRRFTDLDQMKAEEYTYWQSQPVHARLTAGMELAAEGYAMKGVHVSRFHRTLVRSKRA